MQTIRRFLTATIAALVFIVVLATTALAAPTTTKNVTTATSGKCVVHAVHLQGNGRADISCAVYATNPSGGPTPYTTEDYCTGNGARLEIDSNTTGSYCFYGSGYLGLGDPGGLGDINQVVAVKSLFYWDWAGQGVCGSGWVLYYTVRNGASKFYFASCNTYNSSNSVFNGQPWITQVNLNA